MKNLRFFSDAKDFLSNEVNRVFIAVLAFGIILIGLQYYYNMQRVKTEEKILQAIEKAEKKVDFRYFITTKSLEDIHNVEINTLTGEIKPIRRKVNNP